MALTRQQKKSSQLIREITGPPKMSLPLEAQSMPALIIKPRLIIVTHTDYFCWYITSNQLLGRLSFKTSPGLSAIRMLPQSRSSIAPQTVFQLTRCCRRTFLLMHKFGTAGAIKITADSEKRSEYLSVIQLQPVLGQEHQSSGGQVFHHVHGLGREPTDRNRRQLRSQRL